MIVKDKWQAECASVRGIVQEWFVRVDGDDFATTTSAAVPFDRWFFMGIPL